MRDKARTLISPGGRSGSCTRVASVEQLSVVPLAVSPGAGGKSCAPDHSRSRGGAARPSARLVARPTAHDFRPHRPVGTREHADGAQDRGASCSDRQMQRFTLPRIARLAGLGREHQTQRVDHVRSRLLARQSLAEDASDLGNRCNDPAVLTRLIDDRQVKLLSHSTHDTGRPTAQPAGSRERSLARKILGISMALIRHQPHDGECPINGGSGLVGLVDFSLEGYCECVEGRLPSLWPSGPGLVPWGRVSGLRGRGTSGRRCRWGSGRGLGRRVGSGR